MATGSGLGGPVICNMWLPCTRNSWCSIRFVVRVLPTSLAANAMEEGSKKTATDLSASLAGTGVMCSSRGSSANV